LISVGITQEIIEHTSSTIVDDIASALSKDLPLNQITYRPSTNSHSRVNKIPRPPNAFIHFKSRFLEQKKREKDPIVKNQAEFSRYAGSVWTALPEEEKERWKAEALVIKSQHAEQNPGYRYLPTSKKAKTTSTSRSSKVAKPGAGKATKGRHRSSTRTDSTSALLNPAPIKVEPQTPEFTYQPLPPTSSLDYGLRLPQAESSDTSQLDYYLDYQKYINESLVSTEAIPYPDLSAAVEVKPPVRNAISKHADSNPSISQKQETNDDVQKNLGGSPVPHSYLHIEPQFGFRPEIQHRGLKPMSQNPTLGGGFACQEESVNEVPSAFHQNALSSTDSALFPTMHHDLNYCYDLDFVGGAFNSNQMSADTIDMGLGKFSFFDNVF